MNPQEEHRLKYLRDKAAAAKKKLERSNEVYWVNGEAWKRGKKMANQKAIRADAQKKLDERRAVERANTRPTGLGQARATAAKLKQKKALASVFFQ